MALLNSCEITGVKAVSCLIVGMFDNVVKTGSKAGDHQSPESLYGYLCTLDTASSGISRGHDVGRHTSRHKSGNFRRDNTTSKQAVDINGISSFAYVDLGSSCTTIRQQEAERLALVIDATEKTVLHGYGNGRTPTIGTTSFRIKVDDVETTVSAHIVANVAQEIPILLGRNFTEVPDLLVIKDDISLTFFSRSLGEINAIDTEPNDSKIILWIAENTTILQNHMFRLIVIPMKKVLKIPYTSNNKTPTSQDNQENAVATPNRPVAPSTSNECDRTDNDNDSFSDSSENNFYDCIQNNKQQIDSCDKPTNVPLTALNKDTNNHSFNRFGPESAKVPPQHCKNPCEEQPPSLEAMPAKPSNSEVTKLATGATTKRPAIVSKKQERPQESEAEPQASTARHDSLGSRRPSRLRRPPSYLKEYNVNSEEEEYT
ncbi:unnamed protein product [Ceutorhynchus assimilis]|uniref:Peptidase A2 domain-containing protein n=1 Tax=Ceutorhynchus assimilis TaxID=467358 RepID=A0A9N9MEE5_9CUCU|nr:unnamed protein product [Ceutorhynchus assimilis]